MTDERLEELLKQALTLEIDDSEIQIQRKVGNRKVCMKKIIVGGLVACATLSLVVVGENMGIFAPKGDSEIVSTNDRSKTASNNFFTITAHAAESPEEISSGNSEKLPEGISSGDVLGLNTTMTYGAGGYLPGRFAISGKNIAEVKISIDKCEIYTITSVYPDDSAFEEAQNSEKNGLDTYYGVYEGEPEEGGSIAYYECLQVAGQSYKGTYDSNTLFGVHIPEKLLSTNEDMKEADHENINQVDGAILSIEVTFMDGDTEIHNYRLTTGRIFVPVDEKGNCKYDNLTRFLTSQEETTETPNVYGFLMKKID